MAKALRNKKADEELEVKVPVEEVKEEEAKAKKVEEKEAETAKAEEAEEKEADEVEVTEVKADAKGKAKAEPNVRIKPNQDIRTYIGDQWYSLTKGKQETVPQTVKAILQKAGMLDAL